MQLRDTLRHYAWVIQKCFRLIWLGVTICTCTTIGFSLCLPPEYQASALIMVDETTNSDIYSNQALAFSYAFLVTKDDVLQMAAQQLPRISVSQLKQSVSDSLISNTPIIEIRAQSANPQQAALIANIVARSFIHIEVGKASAELQNQDNQFSQSLQMARAASDAAQAKLILLQIKHASASDIAHQHNLVNTDQANYAALLDSYHHLQLLELQTPDILNISQLAIPPDQPISPHVWLNAGIAVALSLLLMVTIALLLDWMDETIKTEEDVMQLTALNVLGSVPSNVSGPSNVPGKSIVRGEVIEEAFVTISAALLGQYEGKRSILVTSVRSASGTSTVATNLAMALARSGMRVLLIDANLRRPVLHTKGFQYFHTQNLVSCLAEIRMFQESRKQVVTWLQQWRTRTPYLWLLPAGPISSRPASLLSAPEMRVLMQELLACQIIDIFIFDSAGLNEGADAMAIAAVTDATLLVIEAGKEQKETLDKARATFERFNSPILGVIINRWHSGLHSYFYTEHAPIERLEPVMQAKTLPVVAQIPLPHTPRPQILAQEMTPGELLAQAIPPETPPSLVQFSQFVSKSSGTAVPHVTHPTKMLHAVPPNHKGIILPVKPGDAADYSEESGLRHYINSRQGQ